MPRAWCGFAFLLAGCATQSNWLPNPQEIDAQDYTRVFESSIRVLRDHGFRVDRADHRYGIVTTQPLGSPTLLEPWKRTHSSARRSQQSTWTDLRHIVTVTLRPAQDGAAARTYVVQVHAALQRQALPLRRLDGSVRRKGVFTSLGAVPDEWQARGIRDRYWESVGRDGALEEQLLGDIIEASRDMVDDP